MLNVARSLLLAADAFFRTRGQTAAAITVSLVLALSSCGPARTVERKPQVSDDLAAPPSARPPAQSARPSAGSAKPSTVAAAEPERQPEGHNVDPSPPPPPDPAGAPPPPCTPDFLNLPVDGFEPAVLSVPDSTSPTRPVVVVAHGAGGEARWHCELWRHLTKNRGYVLCPSGVSIDRTAPRGHYFPDHHHLEREVLACVQALWKHAADADRSGLVYVGYSQGAIMGALMVVDHGDIFSRLVLIEGGGREWSIPHASRFRSKGGERVLFVCGRARCDAEAHQSAQWLRQAGLEVRTEYARGAGHTPLGEVAERIAQALPWLLEGDERW